VGLDEPLLNPRQGGLRRRFPGADEPGALFKGVPIHCLNVRSNHEIGFATPVIFRLAMQDLETAIDGLKYIAGSTSGLRAGR